MFKFNTMIGVELMLVQREIWNYDPLEAVALLALGEEIAAKAAIAAPGSEHVGWDRAYISGGDDMLICDVFYL